MVAFLFALTIVGVWLACFLAFNDLFLPSASARKYRNVLCIFAHMDDETVLAGGIMSQLVKQGSNVTLMTLTKGDKGNDKRASDENLTHIRKTELTNVLKIFGVKNLIHKSYADDSLETNRSKVRKDVKDAIRSVKPDLVITFDLNGWYGHKDHIICAEEVTDIVKKRYKKADLWYAARPEALNRAARVMARVRGTRLSPRTPPTHKVFIGTNTTNKINAIYQYQSQMSALRPGVTVGPIPMWFFMSAQPFEYILIA